MAGTFPYLCVPLTHTDQKFTHMVTVTYLIPKSKYLMLIYILYMYSTLYLLDARTREHLAPDGRIHRILWPPLRALHEEQGAPNQPDTAGCFHRGRSLHNRSPRHLLRRGGGRAGVLPNGGRRRRPHGIYVPDEEGLFLLGRRVILIIILTDHRIIIPSMV